MDNDTCIAGLKSSVSYGYLIQLSEYQPKIGSKDQPRKFSVQQIKRIIASLVQRGWIVALHDKSQIKSRMVFKFPVAEVEKNRLREDRHLSDTRTPTQKNTPESPVKPDVNNLATTVERHESSDTNLSNLNITLYNAHEIILTTELINISRSVGFESDEEFLQTELEVFINHQNNRHKTQTLSDWKSDWRAWCARGKQFKRGSTHANNQITDEKDRVSKQLDDPEYALRNF
ncbi:hypothetical protein ABS311_10645 [Catenovulum sediminis]|uniref:DnaT DNA-binding domain-containing protein n=2 Tax=Catenovulum sediminis TaxID=1740262 RepID=A0ABV1RHC8_9ALTE